MVPRKLMPSSLIFEMKAFFITSGSIACDTDKMWRCLAAKRVGAADFVWNCTIIQLKKGKNYEKLQ